MFPPPPFPLCINLREPTASALRGATPGARIDKYRSLIMPLRFVRQLRTQTAQSLVLSVKLDARYGHRLAIPVPSSKLHIPCTSRLRISFHLSACVQSARSIVLLVLKIEFCTTSCIIYTIYKNFMKSCAKYLTLILNVGKI